MNAKLKRFLSLALALAVSGVCLTFFITGVESWKAVWNAITGSLSWWLLPALLCIWASVVARAYRWRIFLLDAKPIPAYRLYNMSMIGILVNGTIPARVGEMVKAFFLARKEEISFFGAFATVVVERILDLALVVALTVVMLLAFPFPEGKMVVIPRLDEPVAVDALFRQIGLGFGLFCAGMLGFVAFLAYWPDKVLRLIKGVFGKRLGTYLTGLLQSFLGGISVFRKPGEALLSGVWTLPVWGGIMLSEYFLFLSFGIQAGILGACLLTAALALAVAIPQAPGFLGVFQIATCMVLEVCFEVDPNTAAAYAIVLWVVQMAFLIGLGFVSLALEGLSFQEIREAEQEKSAACAIAGEGED